MKTEQEEREAVKKSTDQKHWIYLEIDLGTN